MKQLKRYTLSGDQRYDHNRDSAWSDKENLFIYEDENGKWVKFEDIGNFFVEAVEEAKILLKHNHKL